MIERSVTIVRFLLRDSIGSILWFPVWWYSKGLVMVIAKIRSALSYRIRQYGFRIWMANFFVPMYGQYSLTGRGVSLFMRFFVLIGRAIAFFIEASVYGIGLFCWVGGPILFLILLFANLFSSVARML